MDVRTDRQTDSSSRSARSLGSAWGATGTQGCFSAARVRARGDGPAKNTWGGVKLEGGEMEVSLFTTGLFFPRFPSHCTTQILSYRSQHLAKRRSRPSFFTTPEQIFLLAADQGWSPCLVWSSACPSGTLYVPLAWQERWQLSGSFWASPGAVWAILFSCFLLVCVRACHPRAVLHSLLVAVPCSGELAVP